ncbi:MAG: AAA family ATPase [Acidiferrobacterales bacterium]|nr:AAA family ATPase [Acidiferrobacterales bacterium]
MKSADKTGKATDQPESREPAVRKQVTVLFCDIADYTSRASSIDPEELAEEIHEFQSICRATAESFQGHISNYLGDGVMVLFGHPNASEFSPERAVRAGLAMVAAIKKNNQTAKWRNKPPLAIRIGIATGLVVVGDRAGEMRDQDELIFGSAPNLAARLQAIAKPNTVVTALRTRKLVGLAFKFRELGRFDLKGFSHPVSAWQILTERKLQKRAGNILYRNSAGFISRTSELRLLKKNFESARYGFSRFIHIQGEPGIGKTRLIRTFEKELNPNEVHRIRINCSPYHQSGYLRPIRDECFRWLRITDDDDTETKQTSISWAMSIVRLKEIDQYLLFTELLNLEPPTGLTETSLDPEEKRRRIISVLVDVVYAVARNRPVILIAEDLHWADPSTLEFIEHLLDRSSEEQVLGVFTSRAHFQPLWGAHQSLVEVKLEGLTQAESSRFVDSIFSQYELPVGLKQNLVKKSDGVPLFLEESCLSALGYLSNEDSNNNLPVGYDVPETLQDSLNARLDQLGPAKPLAQLASTFGDSFSHTDIAFIAQQNQIDMEPHLDKLIAENIVVPDVDLTSGKYKFHHTMFQEAAYLSLLIKTRQLYHAEIANLFLENDPDFPKKYPEVLAHHLGKTEQTVRAIELWNKAGKLAIAKSAFLEAIEHIQQGLSLIGTVENQETRKSLELDLLLNLGVSLTARAGYYGYEVTRTYERAVDLARDVGDDRQEWTALYGYWRCQIAQAEFGEGVRLSAKLTALSKRIDEPLMTLTCLGIRAMTRLVDGKLEKADLLTRHSVAFHESSKDLFAGQRFGQDPYVTIQGLGAVAQLLRGNIPDSLNSIARSLSAARRVAHPYTIAEALKVASMYQQLSCNMVQLRIHCEEAIALSERYGFDGVLATHKIFLAFADVITHKDKTRIPVIEENLVLYEQKYGLLFIPYFKSILAEAHLQLGQYQEAFDVSDIVLEDIEICGEKWVLPVAYCIKSEAAIRGELADIDSAREWYAKSLESAYEQDARLMMGRTLQGHFFFDLDPELVEKYRALAGHDDESFLTTNHDFITQKH